ncbi:hypothetical protein [Rahnella sp. ChDrAdgB13]|uniref:hypothetical protein n=1 Tax=Rahnella sp. ChDrAdgB13 TaxID=1850581 RepID=UPI001AD85F79|nr:hypothetical protein [Rahnella sp. ChDrAdgB13]
MCGIHDEILRLGAAQLTPCPHDSPAHSGINKGDAASRSADVNGLNAPFTARTGEDAGVSAPLFMQQQGYSAGTAFMPAGATPRHK